uniref:Col_cuticle_N domain-containing protein n=1 Tax=Steinernema glaseri TaxID=37863 RepID=A0A1I7ZP42_9BILA
MQINVAMWKGRGIQFPVDLTQFKSSVVPVVVSYETAKVDAETLQMIQERLIKTEKIATMSSYVGIALALIFALLAGVVLLYLTGKLEYLLCRESSPFGGSDSVSPLPNGKAKAMSEDSAL